LECVKYNFTKIWNDYITSKAKEFAGGFYMRCVNCGNDDERTLWDEGDTIYCSKCCHRTSLETGKDDLVECPYCHYMRDRKAFYCRHCNVAWGAEIDEEETKELLKILQDDFSYEK
jgi:uncharacterized C2H2 Zn-finger protein